MMGVSVICLLFPLRPEEENLRRRTKGGKNYYSNGGGEENDCPSSFCPRLLPFFSLRCVPNLISSLSHSASFSHVLLISRGSDGATASVASAA